MPESQASPLEEPINLKEKPNSQKEFAKPPKHIKNSTQGNRKSSQLEVNMLSKLLLITNIKSLLYIITEKKHLEIC